MKVFVLISLLFVQQALAATKLCLKTREQCNYQEEVPDRYFLTNEELGELIAPKTPPVTEQAKQHLKSRFKWWQLTLAGLGMAIPEFFLNTFIHEGAHAIVAMGFGNKVVEFQPWPHMKNGEFYFGRMRYSGENITPQARMWTSAAPMLTDAMMISILFGISAGGKFPKHKMGAMALLVFSAGFVVDLVNHVKSTNPRSDINKLESRLSEATGWSRKATTAFIRTLHGVFIAGGLYILIKEGIKIFRGTAGPWRTKKLSRWRRRLRKHQFEVAPMVDGETMGVSFGGRF